MFSDVLTIKEAFLEYKDVSFSKSKKSDFIAPAGISSRRRNPEGTLVTCAYIKESTYGWNIQSVCQKKSRFAWTRAAWNRQ